MSSPTTETAPTPAPAVDAKPETQPTLSWAARAKQTLPPSHIDSTITPSSVPAKASVEDTPAPSHSSSNNKSKSDKASRPPRAPRPDQSAGHRASEKRKGEGRHPSARSGSSKHHEGKGEGKGKQSVADKSTEGGAAKATPAPVDGAAPVEGDAAAPVDAEEKPSVPPPVRKPAGPPKVNIWKVRAADTAAKTPEEAAKEGATKKTHKKDSSKASNSAATSADASQPSFPSLADAPAPTSKRSSSARRSESSPASAALAKAGSGEDEGSASGQGANAEGKPGKKTKWVAIPAQEMQASIDLAERAKKSRTPRDSTSAPAPRAANKKKAAAAAPGASNAASTSTPAAAAPSKKAAKKTEAGAEDAGKKAESASSPKTHGGVSLGIEGMMRKDEEVVEISSEVERSLLRALGANPTSPYSPQEQDVLAFDLQEGGRHPDAAADEASSKPLIAPAPVTKVKISAPSADHVDPAPKSATRGGRGGSQSGRGGPYNGRGGPRGGMGGSFNNRSNPFAAPFHQMQQQHHHQNGGPLPVNGAFPTSPNGHPNGLSTGAGSFVPAGAAHSPSSTFANGQALPPVNQNNHLSANQAVNGPGAPFYAPPPMPTPVTIPSFPLDPLRYYLLGQLEYYFGPQNLAMDFFLRQQMDSLGWVSLPLLATFNRVKNLTSDLAIVREMFALSKLVEVKGDKVRLVNKGWAQWVLPGAKKSEEQDDEEEVKQAKEEVKKTETAKVVEKLVEGEATKSGEKTPEEVEEEKEVEATDAQL